MFFKGMIEDLGPISRELTLPAMNFAKMVNIEYALRRNEDCFNKYDNRTIIVFDRFKVGYAPAYAACKPLIDYMHENATMRHEEPMEPYRIEMSFVRPHSRVTEHYDTYRFHAECDRVHVPLVTRGSILTSKWHTSDQWREFTLQLDNLYRLNNRVPHQALNDTSDVRVHLISDFLPSRLRYDEVNNERDQRELVEYEATDHDFLYNDDA